jgi:hypothetical protein
VFRRGELLRAAEVAWIDETLAALTANAKRQAKATSKRAATKTKSSKSSRARRIE